MANARIDENRENSQLAVDASEVTHNLLVDSTTGRLLIDISLSNGTTLNGSKIDENREGVALAVDENEVVRPFLVDSSNNLNIDLLLE